MNIRVIHEGERGCGRRKPGGVYLVSTPGDGILPLAVLIDPPVPYDGSHFRGAVAVDLDAILQRLPEEEWLVGVSAERARKQDLAQFELETYGMSLAKREKTGAGLETFSDLLLTPTIALRLGAHLRALGKLRLGKVAREVPKAFQAIQAFSPTIVLGCAWRMYSGCPPSVKSEAIHHIRAMAFLVGAAADAGEMR